MVKIIAFIISVIALQGLQAQTNSVATIQERLQTATTDEKLIDVLGNIGENTYRNQSKDLQPILFDLYKKKFPEQKSVFFSALYNAVAQTYNNLRKYDSAAFYFKKGIAIATDVKSDSMLGVLYQHHGYNFYSTNILDSALVYYNKCIKIREKDSDKKLLAVPYNSIGLVYRTRGNYEVAKYYYNKSLSCYTIQTAATLSVLSNIATIYNLEKKYDSATIIFKDIIAKAEHLKEPSIVLQTKINMALALNFQEKYAESLPVFTELANNPTVKRIEDLNNAIQYGLGQCYAGLHECDKAIPILKNCLNMRFKNSRYQSLAAITHLLYKCEKENNNYEAALGYYVQLKNYSDSLLNTKNLENLNELKTKYQTEQKEKDIALLNKDNEVKNLLLNQQTQLLLLEQTKSNEKQQRILLLNKENELKNLTLLKKEQAFQLVNAKNKQATTQVTLLEKDIALQKAELNEKRKTAWLYTLGASLALLLAVGTFLLYYQNKKNSKVLEAKNAIISTSLSEKEVLLKEIHHRVKNNLQVVSSLLNLQSRSISDENALAAIKEGRDRVKSMALLHQNLYQENNLRGVDVKNYIEVLTQSLFASYNIATDKVGLKTNIAAINLDVETVLPIGLIMNELISNALKYAFQEGQQGILEVILQHNDKGLLLSVKDNGKGLPEGFNTDKLTSLGYQLIKSFVTKMKGQLSIINNNGTQVEIFIHQYKLVV
jgi:two-component system, sensor histidine kinase PdtaS